MYLYRTQTQNYVVKIRSNCSPISSNDDEGQGNSQPKQVVSMYSESVIAHQTVQIIFWATSFIENQSKEWSDPEIKVRKYGAKPSRFLAHYNSLQTLFYCTKWASRLNSNRGQAMKLIPVVSITDFQLVILRSYLREKNSLRIPSIKSTNSNS